MSFPRFIIQATTADRYQVVPADPASSACPVPGGADLSWEQAEALRDRLNAEAATWPTLHVFQTVRLSVSDQPDPVEGMVRYLYHDVLGAPTADVILPDGRMVPQHIKYLEAVAR
jgi:hypothetical protein